MNLLWADWPAPAGVHALVTTRQGGVSQAPWDSLNLGEHVGDVAAHVRRNREYLRTGLPGQPAIQWLTQVHGNTVLTATPASLPLVPEADAAYTRSTGLACSVMTADCLPVCFSSLDGHEVAIAHAGWRGLAAGVLESTVRAFQALPEQLCAWLGPAIGPCHFEVGAEVRAAFLAASAGSEAACASSNDGRWLADLYQLARLRLQALGLTQIHGGGLCTYCEHERFYSYRRDGVSGRFATLIYRHPVAE